MGCVGPPGGVRPAHRAAGAVRPTCRRRGKRASAAVRRQRAAERLDDPCILSWNADGLMTGEEENKHGTLHKFCPLPRPRLTRDLVLQTRPESKVEHVGENLPRSKHSPKAEELEAEVRDQEPCFENTGDDPHARRDLRRRDAGEVALQATRAARSGLHAPRARAAVLCGPSPG